METYNGKELKRLLDTCEEQGVNYEVKVTSIQGLKGIYLVTSKAVEVDGDYANAFLISEQV